MTALAIALIAAMIGFLIAMDRKERAARAKLIAEGRCTLCEQPMGDEPGDDHRECLLDHRDATAW